MSECQIIMGSNCIPLAAYLAVSIRLLPITKVDEGGVPHHVRPYCTGNSIRFRLESVSVFKE